MVSQIPIVRPDKESAHTSVNDLSRGVSRLVDEINDNPLAPAVLVSVSLGASAQPVAHNLGYIPNGFILVRKSATFDVYEDTTAANPDARRYMMLRTTSGTQQVSIVFF